MSHHAKTSIVLVIYQDGVKNVLIRMEMLKNSVRNVLRDTFMMMIRENVLRLQRGKRSRQTAMKPENHDVGLCTRIYCINE